MDPNAILSAVHLTIVAAGSRGDVEPYTALGAGFHRAGYEVRLASHPVFEELVRSQGLDFAPLTVDARALADRNAGVAWIESGRNPLKFGRRLARLLEPLLEQIATDAENACRGSDAVIFSGLSVTAYHVADKLGIPYVASFLQPATRTRAFPNPFVGSRSLGAPGNWLTHVLAEQVLWQPMRQPFNRWREAQGLPALPWNGPWAQARRERLPVIYGFSQTVVPKPRDWGSWIEVAGYWSRVPDESWEPSAELAAFLERNGRPVYVGFGSMVTRDPKALGTLVSEAVRRAGVRAVVHAGWAELDLDHDEIEIVDEVPHSWLFPRMAAVVHHGGAGTTAAGLRAGVPTVVVAFFADQPFWGRRVFELGAGPAPVMVDALDATTLAKRIRTSVGDQSIKRRVEAIGRRLMAEDGVAAGIGALERHLARVR